MKNLLFIIPFVFFGTAAFSQTSLFEDEMSVINYMEGKIFYNEELGLQITYGFLPSGNTNAITVKNREGGTFHVINVGIDAYGSFADLSGMDLNSGGSFGFRLFKGRLVVGYGEPGAKTFYLK
ncbi:MAG: hypothetical protein ACKOA1_05730 [Bacteroidota bacterium]